MGCLSVRIQVVLHSYLREKLPAQAKGRVALDLPEGATVADVFHRLGLPEQAAWSVNGVLQRDLSLRLAEGDELRVFRQGAGG